MTLYRRTECLPYTTNLHFIVQYSVCECDRPQASLRTFLFIQDADTPLCNPLFIGSNEEVLPVYDPSDNNTATPSEVRYIKDGCN